MKYICKNESCPLKYTRIDFYSNKIDQYILDYGLSLYCIGCRTKINLEQDIIDDKTFSNELFLATEQSDNLKKIFKEIIKPAMNGSQDLIALAKVSITPRLPNGETIRNDVLTVLAQARKTTLFVPFYGDCFPEKDAILANYRNNANSRNIRVIGFLMNESGLVNKADLLNQIANR